MYNISLYIVYHRIINKDKWLARVFCQGKRIIYFCTLLKLALLVIFTWLSCIQRGLKDIEHKPLCRHYQGVSHACQNEIRSSDPHTCENTDRSLCMCTHAAKLPFNQLECSWRSISYIVHLSSLRRGLLTPSDNFAHCLFRKHDTVNTRDIAWVP